MKIFDQLNSGSSEPFRSVSVVVPVYNSEGTLSELVTRLESVLTPIVGNFELIMVNDGSRDASWAVLCGLASNRPWLRPVDLMRNFGQHCALLCGIRQARHEVIVTMDDDLQHPPEEIPRLLNKLAEGYDVVYGSPREERHGWWRDAASKVSKIGLMAALGGPQAAFAGAFRAFRTHLRDGFAAYRSPWVSIDVLLTWSTNRFGREIVRHELRPTGYSNYTLRKLMRHALVNITGFSVLPLRIASLMGCASAFLGLIALSYVVVGYFAHGSPVAGFPFLASLIAVLSGAQLLALGVMGEYIATLHQRALEKPCYVIRPEERHGDDHPS